MTTEIFIVTYAPDFQYLKFCLRSIEKFAAGFAGVNILVPVTDLVPLANLVGETFLHTTSVPVAIKGGDEWPALGMLWHMHEILYADRHCPTADFVVHLDADCVFTEPVTPDDYIQNGKPILLYESFATLGPQHPEILRWQECTRLCLPFDPPYETMRQHPEVYHRNLYAQTRQRIEEKTGQSVETYLRRQRNEYPQTFCEFVTLGNVAMHDFPNQYQLYDLAQLPWRHAKLYQAWSHRPPIEENLAVYRKAGIL